MSSLPSHLRSAFQPSSRPGVEVLAPSLVHAPQSRWQRLLFRLISPALTAAPPPGQLAGVRADFLAAIEDLRTLEARLVGDRVRVARSLRELWHLRSEIYRVVALARSQFEAEERVQALNRHFSTRPVRASAFAPL